MTTLPLAMHMADLLLDLPTAAVTLAVAACAVTVAAWRVGKTVDADKLPLMGVMGAFVFAAQMINFTLPGMPGTSGHIGGAVLLAILLGPAASIVTMTSILIVQCLLFADGGLLALGCNIINMGVIPSLLGWTIHRAIAGDIGSARPVRTYLGVWLACLAGVTAGAAMVPVETLLAGRLYIPVMHFLAVMVGVHLLIGCMEGLITVAVLAFLRRIRLQTPDFAAPANVQKGLSRRAATALVLLMALLLSGVVSWLASTQPDGLEWSYAEHEYGRAADGAIAPSSPSSPASAAGRLQEAYSPMPDYTRRPASISSEAAIAEDAENAWPALNGWRSLAGVVGTMTTLVLVYVVAGVLRRIRPSHARGLSGASQRG